MEAGVASILEPSSTMSSEPSVVCSDTVKLDLGIGQLPDGQASGERGVDL